MGGDDGNPSESGAPEMRLSEEQLIVFGFNYQSTLLQFVHPRMRSDLLRGKFPSTKHFVGHENTPEKVLQGIDCLRMKVTPGFQYSVSLRESSARQAACCLRKLVRRSSEVLHMSDEFSSYQWTYLEWSRLLDDIISCPQWDAYSPAQISLQYLTVPKRLCEDDAAVKHEQELPQDKKLPCGDGALFKREVQPNLLDSPAANLEVKREPATRELICFSDSSVSSMSSVESYESSTKRPTGVHSKNMFMQRKEVVKPNVFVMNSWQTLRQFLQSYERYFDAKFEGNSRDRTRALSEFLPSSMLEYYSALGGHKLKYPDMKKELISWYNRQEKLDARHWRVKFTEEKMKNNEPLKVFALRLQETSNKAFPRSDRERERELKHKFLETVPSSFARHIQITQDAARAAGTAGKLSWIDIVRLAEKEDERRKKSGRSNNEVEEQRSVWYSRPETREMHGDVVTCSNVNQSAENPAASHCKCCAAHVEQDSHKDSSKSLESRRHPPRIFSQTNRNQQEAVSQPQASSPSTGDYQRGSSRRQQFSPSNRKSCNWCGRQGHMEDTCWLRLGHCLLCGGDDHNKIDCPRNKINANKDQKQTVCPVCRGPHLGKDCQENQLNEQTPLMQGNQRSG